MKINKGISVLLTGVLLSGMLVGCGNDDKNEEVVTIKYVDEQGNTVKEEKTTKEKADNIKQKQETKKQEVKKEEGKSNTTKKPKQNIEHCVTCGKEIDVSNGFSFDEDGIKCKNCIHKSANCGHQMKELYAHNYFCVNPNCVSYTNPNDLFDNNDDYEEDNNEPEQMPSDNDDYEDEPDNSDYEDEEYEEEEEYSDEVDIIDDTDEDINN